MYAQCVRVREVPSAQGSVVNSGATHSFNLYVKLLPGGQWLASQKIDKDIIMKDTYGEIGNK